jgi:RNA polymerase sigma factor
MDAEHFTETILLAKGDKRALNTLITEFLPFIRKCVSGVFARPDARREHLTEGMLAFTRSVETYMPEKGAFTSYAATVIRNSLINAGKKESSISGPLLSLTTVSVDDTERGSDAAWEYEAARQKYNALERRDSLRAEIDELRGEFARWGFDWAALVKNCPRQKRSKALCHLAVQKALVDAELTAEMLSRRVLPLKKLAAVSGVPEKKLEYFRCYIAALVLIHSGDYPYLRAFVPEELS